MKKIWFTLALIILMAPVAFAQVPTYVEEEGSTDDYWHETGDKLGKGVANVALGWTQPIQDLRNAGPDANKVTTFLDGIMMGATRTIVGGIQIVTAFCPKTGWEGDAELNLN
jgi:hypothetical protein